MSPRYWKSLAVAAAGLVALIWGVADSSLISGLVLFVGAAAFPIAVLLAVAGRMNATPPLGSLIGGGAFGPLVAVLSHALVFGFAYLFFLGFADEAASLLEAVRIDPAVVEIAGSPWMLLVFFEFVLFAPFTEEIGKATGAWMQRPNSRADAFMAGVAAGVGFAIVENVLYASAGLFLGQAWEVIVAVRMLGAAVHPLATGIVVMGWWEWRQHGDIGLLAHRFLSGVGVHAAWNGAIVALGVVANAYGVDQLAGLGALAVAFSAGLGAIGLAFLFRVAASLADEDSSLAGFVATDARTIGVWTLLAASLLVPVALLFLAYPDFVGG